MLASVREKKWSGTDKKCQCEAICVAGVETST